MSVILKGTLAQTNIIRAAVGVVRQVIEKNDLSKGASTEEIYQLALNVPPPPGFKGDPRLAAVHEVRRVVLPPHNDHPIRSKGFLKRTILPALVGTGEIAKVRTARLATSPIPVVKKGKAKKRATPETAHASSANPVTIPAWVWKPCEASTDAKPEAEGNPELRSARVEQPDGWLHLNKRRHRARLEKGQIES